MRNFGLLGGSYSAAGHAINLPTKISSRFVYFSIYSLGDRKLDITLIMLIKFLILDVKIVPFVEEELRILSSLFELLNPIRIYYKDTSSSLETPNNSIKVSLD